MHQCGQCDGYEIFLSFLAYVRARPNLLTYKGDMSTRNFSKTAEYFERRAAKASRTQRRERLESVAQLYREKAKGGAESSGGDTAFTRPSRRDRLAAMFREFGDPESIARGYASRQSRPRN